MDSEIFEKLPPTKLFFRLALPSMITMAFGALYQIADGLFVGRFIGEDALAAVNLIMPIIMIVFGFANLIATGASKAEAVKGMIEGPVTPQLPASILQQHDDVVIFLDEAAAALLK